MTTLADSTKTTLVRHRPAQQNPVKAAGKAMAARAAEQRPSQERSNSGVPAARPAKASQSSPPSRPVKGKLSVFERELLTAWATE